MRLTITRKNLFRETLTQSKTAVREFRVDTHMGLMFNWNGLHFRLVCPECHTVVRKIIPSPQKTYVENFPERARCSRGCLQLTKDEPHIGARPEVLEKMLDHWLERRGIRDPLDRALHLHALMTSLDQFRGEWEATQPAALLPLLWRRWRVLRGWHNRKIV